MTRRGRAVLALGLVVYVAAWVFGSRALYPVATGLVLAVLLAVGWVRLSARPPRVRRHGATRDVLEGDDVRVDLVEQACSLTPTVCRLRPVTVDASPAASSFAPWRAGATPSTRCA